MNKMQFEGIVILKNGETKKFDNIAKYNEFVVNNYEQIESTESKSKFIQVQENEDIPVKSQEKIKLSSLVAKALESIKEDANEKRCNTIGENLEDTIHLYMDDNNLILDIDVCLDILNDFADKSQNDWCNSKEDLKKLESEITEKKKEIEYNFNKVRFADAMKNMCKDYNINYTEENDIKTSFDGVDGTILDLNKLLDIHLNDSNKELSDNIKRFLKAIRNAE